MDVLHRLDDIHEKSSKIKVLYNHLMFSFSICIIGQLIPAASTKSYKTAQQHGKESSKQILQPSGKPMSWLAWNLLSIHSLPSPSFETNCC
jgi:hypothetical protein